MFEWDTYVSVSCALPWEIYRTSDTPARVGARGWSGVILPY